MGSGRLSLSRGALCEQFVLGMLEKLDLICEDDYKPFLTQFDNLDKTKVMLSGCLAAA